MLGSASFPKCQTRCFLPISSAYTNSIFSVSNTKQEIGCHMIKVKCDVTSIKKYIQISVFMVLIEMTDLNIDIQMCLVARKPVFRVSDRAIFKLDSSATETS